MTDTAAFDALAADYDVRFSNRLPATWLRTAVHRRVGPLLHADARVIELGCGSGEDAIWLAQQGCNVWAMDASIEMLERARSKIAAAGLTERVELQCLDLNAWHEMDMTESPIADLVFSNFGALNCIGDLEPVLSAAWRRLKPDGLVAITLMGRFCLSETLYFLARGQLKKAGRRWRSRAWFKVGAERFPVWYHSPRRVEASATNFNRLATYGIGGMLPPSEGYWLCERWPRLFSTAAAIDFRLSRLLFGISDHYLMILQKRPRQ